MRRRPLTVALVAAVGFALVAALRFDGAMRWFLWLYFAPLVVPLAGHRVYLATDSGVFGVDVSDPSHPRLLSDIPQWRGFAIALAADGAELAVAGINQEGNGLWLLDIASDGTLSRRRFVDLAQVPNALDQQAVTLRDGRAAVADGENGVVVVDASDSGADPPLRWFPVSMSPAASCTWPTTTPSSCSAPSTSRPAARRHPPGRRPSHPRQR